MYTDWESGFKWLKIRYLEWLCGKLGIQVGEAESEHFPKELRPPMTRQTVDLKDSLKGHRKSSVR